ncbi:uncharacterized protein CLAFUR5_20075 [Fulvia fulva]|uniref:uncharacterized protein n=1 Tax=Passalora fulva TaxID=5499 RepID=UPI0028525927|nr:uncharacterized protein CLAFUR5_20075 [Fulvia fulva]WMI38995.1 hypothetical protein CLAFUR5_20075 [Fulvia fulva]
MAVRVLSRVSLYVLGLIFLASIVTPAALGCARERGEVLPASYRHSEEMDAGTSVCIFRVIRSRADQFA